MTIDRGALLAALGGAAAFFALTQGAIVDPRHTAWLFAYPDTASAYLGWQFYRQAPLLQLPFGANPAYGMEIASSVVFSDSIPLAAFLFKPFSGWLPADFQYFGLWLALCFVLQAMLAYRLLMRFCKDHPLALLGCAFFVIAPPFLFRLTFHLALCGQWILLAALNLYFAPRGSRRTWWLLLLGVSAFIHFYLLVMAGALWAADLGQRYWRAEVSLRQGAAEILGITGLTLTFMWLAGYFMAGTAPSASPGFGTYRMNLLAPIDPERVWSRVLPDQPGSKGDIEGFSYLGTGMLVLALFAGYQLLARHGALVLKRPTIVPLMVVSLLLTLFALSNRIGVGAAEFFAYDLPTFAQPLADQLRTSGRMFWPVYYLLYLAILVTVFRGLPRRVALATCAALLALQIADCAQALQQYRDRLAHAPRWVSPLQSQLWAEIGARSARVIYVLPLNASRAFLPWAAFAADHRLAVNFGYFARVDAEKLATARNNTESAIFAGQLQPDSIYVFESEPLWNLASARQRPADLVGVLDDFRIVVPGFAACETCDRSALADVKPGQSPGYVLGERIVFGAGSRQRYPMPGWSPPESWGVWSQASSASLFIGLARLPTRDLMLTLEGRTLAGDALREQRVGVFANGVSVGSMSFAATQGADSRTVRIPKAALARDPGLVTIRLAFLDARPRAFGLVALRLDED